MEQLTLFDNLPESKKVPKKTEFETEVLNYDIRQLKNISKLLSNQARFVKKRIKQIEKVKK
jgi:hypothetical protein